MQFPFQQVQSVCCVYSQHLPHRFKRSSLGAELSTDLKRLIFFLWQEINFYLKKQWCPTLVNTQVFPHHQSQRKSLVIVMAESLFNCTHCAKSLFVAVAIQVALILLLSVTCRSLVVTVSSQLWPSINTAAAEAFMFCALSPHFGLLCMYWINFTLIESSLGFVRNGTVLVCALVRARWRFVSFFCFTPQSDMRACVWVCVW